MSTPLGQIAAALKLINEGRLDVEFAKTRRNDEIGAINDALTLFRDQSLRMREIEQQRAESERKAADERKAAMHKLADEFQAAVGGIVDTVSTASTELESAAGHAHQDRRDHAAALRHGRGRLRRGLRQCAVGRLRHRGDDLVGQRDQPPGAGVEQDRRRGGEAGARRPTRASTNCRRRPAASATS